MGMGHRTESTAERGTAKAMPRWLKVTFRLIELCLIIVGLAGVRSDVHTWGEWLLSISDFAWPSVLVLLGVALIILTEFVLPRVFSWMRMKRQSSHEMVGDGQPFFVAGEGLEVESGTATENAILRCVRKDPPYNVGEIAGFAHGEASRRIESGTWVSVYTDLRNAVDLILAEFELLKLAYEVGAPPEIDLTSRSSEHDEKSQALLNREIQRARADLKEAIYAHLGVAQSFPITAERDFHLRIYRDLSEAIELEESRFPVGLVALGQPIADLQDWLRKRILLDRQFELRGSVRKP